MLETYAIYPDYQKAYNYQEQQKINYVSKFYEPEDNEGFKLMFPVPEPELIQEDVNDDFIEAEKYYDNPETQAQLYELEKYGYYYK